MANGSGLRCAVAVTWRALVAGFLIGRLRSR
jgi:hypothetical protein